MTAQSKDKNDIKSETWIISNNEKGFNMQPKSKDKATKRPWELITDKDTDARYILGNDGTENILDTLYLSGANCLEANANAEFIIKAVNCHDELVLCLKDAIKEMDNSIISSHWEECIAKCEQGGT